MPLLCANDRHSGPRGVCDPGRVSGPKSGEATACNLRSVGVRIVAQYLQAGPQQKRGDLRVDRRVLLDDQLDHLAEQHRVVGHIEGVPADEPRTSTNDLETGKDPIA